MGLRNDGKPPMLSITLELPEEKREWWEGLSTDAQDSVVAETLQRANEGPFDVVTLAGPRYSQAGMQALKYGRSTL